MMRHQESFALLSQYPDALDRIDLKFRWGAYDIRVLRCHLAKFAAGHVIDHHQHSEYEFHFIWQGRGSVTIEGHPYTVGSGEFYLTGPGVDHKQIADSVSPMQELCLHVDIQPAPDAARHISEEDWECREAEECVRALEQFPLQPLKDRFDAMQQFAGAFRAWHDQATGSYTLIKQCIVQILIKSVRAASVVDERIPLPNRDMNEFRFRLAERFIRDNFHHPLRLDDVAERLHISGRQLQRVIKQHANKGFSEYLEDVRLTHIRKLLEQSDETLESIALQSGYSSGAYLQYAFKKKWGITPGEYRRKYRRQSSSL